MFGTFFIMAMAGYAIAFLLSVASFAKSHQYQHNFHTIRDYWKVNAYFDIGGLIFLCVISFILTFPGGGTWLLKLISGVEVPAETPAGLYILAFLLGAANQWLISKLRGIFKPKQFEKESTPQP